MIYYLKDWNRTMTGLKFLALAPFGITIPMLATDVSPNNIFLQYGALGLCAVIVMFLCRFIGQLIDKLDRKDQVMGEQFEANTKAFNRLAELLGDRPCLKKDHRIKGDNNG